MTAEESRLQSLRHARIRRVKQLLKWMPRKSNVGRYPVLKWFSKAARKRPYLWSFKVTSCTPAFYFGSIIAFLPIMGVQILVALLAALFTRANLPIMVGLQGISNPFTFPFILLFNYQAGRYIMNLFSLGTDLNPNLVKFYATFLGGAIVGLIVGASLDLFYRLMVFEAGRHGRRRTVRAEERTEKTRDLPLPEPAREDLTDAEQPEPKELRDEAVR